MPSLNCAKLVCHRKNSLPSAGIEYPAPLLRSMLLSLCILLLSGCGLLSADSDEALDPAHNRGLAAGSSEAAEEAWQGGTPIPYKVEIRSSAADEELLNEMRSLSQLVRLSEEAPDNLLSLERRARTDVELATRLMHSHCYYAGKASFTIDDSASPVTVSLSLDPGTIYLVGSAQISYSPEPVIPQQFRERTRATGFWDIDRERLPPPSFPTSIPDVSIGQPIKAADMLAAVEALPGRLHRQGYPLASIADSRYTLDHEARQLHAHVRIKPGPPALLGELRVEGTEKVNPQYIQRLAPWKKGQVPWDANTVEDYANHLRSIGLFRTVKVHPLTQELETSDQEDGVVTLPLQVDVAEAPLRSVGGSARYDTDTGFGVEAFWEHRNLFGNGERLSLNAPVATEVQGLKAAFEKPAFLMREQRLLLSASALRENTDAYDKSAVTGSVDVERHLSRHWWWSFGMGGESGRIENNEDPEQSYNFFGPRIGLRRDGRNNKLNPTAGSDIWLKLKPYTGFYGESFTALGSTLAVSGYYAPFKKNGQPDDKLVLAGRIELGSMMGTALHSLPSSLRYYKGGAGSVRGYAHQSLGPRDDDDEPLGGRSYQVVNLEARYKITNDIGIVPFLDGGMVYKDELPPLLYDMKWGAGLGLRYYTPIGPVRLDVGCPLQPISGDPPVQIYISIGQAF
jgi:translocation and assembly module TamA